MQPMYDPRPIQVQEEQEEVRKLRSKFHRVLAHVENVSIVERGVLILQLESLLDDVLPTLAGPLPTPPQPSSCPRCGAKL